MLYSCLLSVRLPSGSRTLNWHLETNTYTVLSQASAHPNIDSFVVFRGLYANSCEVTRKSTICIVAKHIIHSCDQSDELQAPLHLAAWFAHTSHSLVCAALYLSISTVQLPTLNFWCLSYRYPMGICPGQYDVTHCTYVARIQAAIKGLVTLFQAQFSCCLSRIVTTQKMSSKINSSRNVWLKK